MPITPLPPVANALKVTVTNTGNDGRPAENVLHWGYSGPAPSAAACVAFATQVWNEYVTHMLPLQPGSTFLTTVTVLDLSSDMANEGIVNNGGVPVPGTNVGTGLALHSCFLISKKIARRYRGGRPRSYLPIGVIDNLNDDGDWLTASVTTFVNAYIAWATAINGTSSGGTTLTQEINVSYYGGAPTVDGKSVRRVVPVVDQVVGVSGEQQLATQRRRVRRR